MSAVMDPPSVDHVQHPVSRLSPVRALARSEARALSRHPLTVVALASLAIVFGMGIDAARDAGPIENGVGYSIWGASLFAWFMLLAANLTMLRGRPAAEICSVTPVTSRARTAGALVGLAGPAVAVFVLAVALDLVLAIVAPTYSIARGPYRVEGLLVVARSLFAIALMGAVGIAVARWVAHPLAGGVVFIASLQASDHPLHPLAGDVTDPVGALVWRIAYVLGMTLVVAGFALMRNGVRRDVFGLAAAGIALIAGRIAFG